MAKQNNKPPDRESDLRFNSVEAQSIFNEKDELKFQRKILDFIKRREALGVKINRTDANFLRQNTVATQRLNDALTRVIASGNDIGKVYERFKDQLQDVIKLGKSRLMLDQRIASTIADQLDNITAAAVEIRKASADGRKHLSIQQSILSAISEQPEAYEKTIQTIKVSGQAATSAVYNLTSELRGIEDMQGLLSLTDVGEGFDSVFNSIEPIGEQLQDIAQELSLSADMLENNAAVQQQVVDRLKAELETRRAITQQLLNEANVTEQIYEKTKSITSSIERQFTQWQAIAKVIPGMGKFGTKLGSIQGALSTSVQDIGKAFATGKGMGKAVAESFSRVTKSLGSSNILMGTLSLAALGVGIALMKGVKMAYDTYKKLVSTSKEVSQSIGLSDKQSYALAKNAFNASLSTANQASTLEDMVAVQKTMSGEYGRVMEMSDTVTAQVADSAKVYGYSNEEAAKLVATFKELGSDNEVLAGNLSVATAQLAEANGLAPGIITKDLVENSKTVMLNFAGMPTKAGQAAVAVRKMGYSLAIAGKVQDHLFQVESSLTAQMEASVGLNRMIDLSKARQYALTGDMVGMMGEMARQAGSYEQFINNSVPEKILLARAMGMEVDEFARSLYIQKFKNKFTDEELAMIQKRADVFTDIEKKTEGELRAQLESVRAQDAINAQVGKLKGELSKALLPAFEAIAGMIVRMAPAIGLLASALGAVLKPVELIAKFIQDITSDETGLWQSLSNMGTGLIDIFKEINAGGITTGGVFKSMLLAIGTISAGIIGWRALINPFIRGLIGGVTYVRDLMATGPRTVGNNPTVTQRAGNALGKMSTGGKAVLGAAAITAAGYGIMKAYDYFSSKVKDGTEDASDKLKESGDKVKVEVPEAMDAGYGGLSGTLGTMMMMMFSTAMPAAAMKGLTSGAGKIGKSVSGVLGKALTGLGSAASGSTIGAVGKVGKVASKVGGFFTKKSAGGAILESVESIGADTLTGGAQSSTHQANASGNSRQRRKARRASARRSGGGAGGAILGSVGDVAGNLSSMNPAAGAGIGGFLTSLATGLGALAVPPVPLGALILAGLMVSLGAALRVAAPAIAAFAPVLQTALEQIAPILSAVFTGLGHVIKSIGDAVAAPVYAMVSMLKTLGAVSKETSLWSIGGGLVRIAKGLLKLAKVAISYSEGIQTIRSFFATLSKLNEFNSYGIEKTVESVQKLVQLKDVSILEKIGAGMSSIAGALSKPFSADLETLYNLSVLTDAPILPIIAKGMEEINKALQLTTKDVQPIDLGALVQLTGVKSADGLTLVAQGIREIGKALRSLDVYILDTLALLASMTFINNQGAKSKPTDVTGALPAPLQAKPIDVTGALPAPLQAVATAPTPSTWLSDRTSVSSLDEYERIKHARTGYTGPQYTTTATDRNIAKMTRLLEQYLEMPPVLAISFDDGSLKRLNTALKKANN